MTRLLGFLDDVGGNSKFREFEESKFRGFVDLVDLVACGLFKIGVLLYLGGGDL